MSSLTFTNLRITNLLRCEESFHPIDAWTETDWGCAVGGEAGEALNKIKKRRRGEAVTVEQVLDELADMVIYADLLATRMQRDLGDAVVAKFNEKSAEVGSPHRL